MTPQMLEQLAQILHQRQAQSMPQLSGPDMVQNPEMAMPPPPQMPMPQQQRPDPMTRVEQDRISMLESQRDQLGAPNKEGLLMQLLRGAGEGLAFGAQAPQMRMQQEQLKRQKMLDLANEAERVRSGVRQRGQDQLQGEQETRMGEQQRQQAEYQTAQLESTNRLRKTQEDAEARRGKMGDAANLAKLRQMGLRPKVDPTTGDITPEFEPIPRGELSPEETADLDAKEGGVALKKSQKELAEATAAWRAIQSDMSSPQYDLAKKRLAVAQQNADTAQERLGLSRESLGIREAQFNISAFPQGKVRPLLDSVSELADKINTGKGLMAKAVGAERQLAAKANYDDDVAEYESMVQAFTPLWARALGHTGVLTQQDVDSAKQALPKPGDSQTLKDRKLARIEKIMAGTVAATEELTGRKEGQNAPQSAPQPAPAPGAAAAPRRTPIKMK